MLVKRETWAEINLDYIKYNINKIREVVKSREIMVAIKSDGYGHGAIEVGKSLLENGVDRLAVAMMREGIELRKEGITAPILVMGYTSNSVVHEVIEYDIETTVISYTYAKALSDEAVKRNKIAKIHIKVDTGMGRLGYLPVEESIREVKEISKLPNIIIEGVFSHLSSADADEEYTRLQEKRFNEFCNALISEGITFNKHLANSAGIIGNLDSHYDIVRVGIMTYGYYPDRNMKNKNLNLKPALTLKAKITQLKELKSGSSIGYGRAFKSTKDIKVATLPIGYGDGYTRMLSGKAHVIVRGRLAPVIGRICMDQCMVDVTHIPDVKEGDEVILIGSDGANNINADYIAELIDTINYEVICMIGRRVPRVYIEHDKVKTIVYYV